MEKAKSEAKQPTGLRYTDIIEHSTNRRVDRMITMFPPIANDFIRIKGVYYRIVMIVHDLDINIREARVEVQ